jgi:hypothetical protein
VQDESTVTLAQEIKRLAAKYGAERFTETSLGFKLAFVSAEGTTKVLLLLVFFSCQRLSLWLTCAATAIPLAVNVVVEVELDTMMYLEEDPPQFKVCFKAGSHYFM